MVPIAPSRVGVETEIILLAIALCFSSTFGQTQTQMRDMVYLKNGRIIKGEIVELTPDKTVRIRTEEGSVFVFSIADVDKISKDPMTKTESLNPESDPLLEKTGENRRQSFRKVSR